MRVTKVLLFILVGVVCVTGSRAETNKVRTLALRECIDLALEQNLSVQIARYNPQMAEFTLAGSYAYYDPLFEASAVHAFNSREGGFNPATGERFADRETETDNYSGGLRGVALGGLSYDMSADFGYRKGSEFDPFYESRTGINLRQPLLRNFWIDIGRRDILVAKKDLQISEADFRLAVMSVLSAVESAYYELIFARENVTVQRKALQLAEQLVAENRRRVEIGTMAPLEQREAEAELATRRAELIVALATVTERENTLKGLMTDDFVAWHGVEIVPAEMLLAIREDVDLMESWRRGMAHRPEIVQARLALEQRDIVLRYQKNQLYPALDLVGSYGHNGLDPHFRGTLHDTRRGDNPFYSYGVVVSVPLSNRGPRNAYQTSKAAKAQALLQFKQLEQDILLDIDNVAKSVQTSFERVQAMREARLYREAALDAEQKKLEAGRSTSFFVLQMQRDLTSARSNEIRALADYNQALAALAFAEGGMLDRHNLSLQPR